MKKFTLYILILVVMVGIFAPIFHVNAQPTGTTPTQPQPIDPAKSYHLLSPLPQVGADYDTSDKYAIGNYLNLMIRVFIGLSAVLAVVMIVLGGIEYMTSELISGKAHGKERLTSAVLGLLLALGSYAILYTINPDILITDLKNLNDANLTVTQRQIKYYSGNGGKCEVISSPSSPCSPNNLATSFGTEADHASAICNAESKGVVTQASGVDTCRDNTSFSFGLFQVNVIAHQNDIPGGVCKGVFKVNGTGTQGSCMPGQQINGICMQHDCQVINSTQYTACVNYITNPINNIAFAADLQKKNSRWGQWGANQSCHY